MWLCLCEFLGVGSGHWQQVVLQGGCELQLEDKGSAMPGTSEEAEHADTLLLRLFDCVGQRK